MYSTSRYSMRYVLLGLISGLIGSNAFKLYGQPHLPQDISRLLDRVAGNGEGYDQTLDAFRALPPEQAQRIAIAGLRKPEYSQRADSRRLLLEVLISHKNQLLPESGVRLVGCLSDPTPDIQRMCCSALPSVVVEEEVSRLVGIAKHKDSDIPVARREMAIRQLTGLGTYAHSAYAETVALFRDIEENERVRWFAAQALLEIGGLARGVGVFEDSDDIGRKVALWAMSKYVGTRTTYDYTLSEEDREALPEARAIAIAMISSKSLETRKAAFESLFVLFGRDYLMGDEETGYSMHPDLRSALASMANGETDPDLAERVRGALTEETRVIEKMLRDRERFRVEQNGANNPSP